MSIELIAGLAVVAFVVVMMMIKGRGDAAEAVKLLREGAVLIDVRSRGEFAGGHIDKAINIPIDELARRLKNIDASKGVVVHCASGMRSSSALSVLREAGITAIANAGSYPSAVAVVKRAFAPPES